MTFPMPTVCPIPTPAPPSGISLVGSVTGSAADGADVTLTLPSMQPGDVVYVFGGHVEFSVTPVGPSTAGYTNLVDQTQTALHFSVDRKVMGGSPDANVVCQGGGGDSRIAVVYGAYVLRGVNATPEDATLTSAAANTGAPDSPSITTVTNDAWVLSLAASRTLDSTVTAPSGYGNQIDHIQSDSNSVTIGGATLQKATAGAENPAAWTNWTSAVWIAATVAVRPA